MPVGHRYPKLLAPRSRLLGWMPGRLWSDPLCRSAGAFAASRRARDRDVADRRVTPEPGRTSFTRTNMRS